jgi:hypothetical protein
MNLNQTFTKALRVLLVASIGLARALHAQQSVDAPVESAIPVIAGDFSFQSRFESGTQTLSPEFDPVLLVPLGRKLLIESEFDMSTDLTHSDGRWGPAVVDHGIEYLQLNYIAHPHLTFTVGRFLTPFGIYRERLHPMWIRNLADEPILFTMNDNSSNGAMARGTARLTSKMNITYATYFSASTKNSQLSADRRAGTRASLFFPNNRLEVGVSFSRVLSDTRYNMLGTDATWSLKNIPFDLHAEALHSAVLGNGYWVEGAYRLERLGRNAFFRNSLLALRGEQYKVPTTTQVLLGDLPDRNTSRTTLGWTYSLYNGVRFNASYGRNFATGENHNIWTVGLTYRFAAF